MIDLVIPNNNEGEFIKMAERLGYSELCFLHPKQKNIEALQKTTKIRLFSDGISVMKSPADLRKAFEKIKPDIIYGLEFSKQKDSVNYRISGLNQVFCKLAVKNGIMIGFAFSMMNDNAEILGRTRQNISLCNKYKADVVIASFAVSPYQMRAPHDLMALFNFLGMQPKTAKLALSNAYERIKENIESKKPGYVKGIKVIDA